MNIIFTRPLIDAEDLMTNFFSSNYKVIHLPTLSINSANMEPINTKEFDGLIFTSANAVRFLQLKNDEKNIKCFCVANKPLRKRNKKKIIKAMIISEIFIPEIPFFQTSINNSINSSVLSIFNFFYF